MKASTFLTVLCTLVFNTTQAQQHFSLPGKWQLVEHQGNDGARDYVQPVENGETWLFEPNHLVKHSTGKTGTYSLNGQHLTLHLGAAPVYFLALYNDQQPDTLYLVPTTAKYQCICDEGCSDKYVRRPYPETTPASLPAADSSLGIIRIKAAIHYSDEDTTLHITTGFSQPSGPAYSCCAGENNFQKIMWLPDSILLTPANEQLQLINSTGFTAMSRCLTSSTTAIKV